MTNPSRIDDFNSAYAAAAWASGETLASLGQTFGYDGAGGIRPVIIKFIHKYSGLDWNEVYYASAERRKELIPAALSAFKVRL